LQRDFLLAYGLFVQSFVRRMEALLVPAVLVCYDVQAYETDTIQILGSLFERFLPSQMFLPVLVSQKPYLPPELRDFPYRKLRIPAIDDAVIDELSRRFLNESPGGARPAEWIRERTGGNIVSMFYLFHVQTRPDLKETDATDVPPELRTVWSAICGLGSAEQTVLYAAMLCWELLPGLRTIEILSELDIPQARIPEITKLLADLNLVDCETLLTPSVPELEKPLAVLLGDTASEARRIIVARALDLRRKRLIPVSEVLFEVSRGAVDPMEERRLFGELIADLLDQRELAAAFRLLHGDCPYQIDTPSPDTDPIERAIVLGLRLRLALLANDRRAAETAFERTGSAEIELEPGAPKADLLLQRARFLFYRGEHGPALNFIKQAIILYQDVADARGLAAAHSEFGLLMLAQEQLVDAREYFVIAGKYVEPEVSVYEYVRSHALETASHFVYGSYTRVVERIEQLSDLAVQAGMREWGLYLMLVRGRVLFELGRYEEAQRHFQCSLTEAQLCQHIPAHTVFYAWLARSLAYAGVTGRAIEMLTGMRVTRETELFIAEAHIFDENFVEALAALDRAAGISPENEHFTAESLAWQSGFSDLEDLTVGRTGSGLVWGHLLKAFHGYALARVGHRVEGIAEMHRLTREDGVSKLDPYNHLYYLLYALILPDAREAGRDPAFEDRLTVLGKAVKNMQQRLTRIDRYDDKISYQRHSRWNGVLFSEAIAHNLL
ncbi:MAG TPA: hypothetical protein VMW87_15055, partial [Spirochaetia bacterium]|nr:hypothetical protein [Spirochaetia bacterium]